MGFWLLRGEEGALERAGDRLVPRASWPPPGPPHDASITRPEEGGERGAYKTSRRGWHDAAGPDLCPRSSHGTSPTSRRPAKVSAHRRCAPLGEGPRALPRGSYPGVSAASEPQPAAQLGRKARTPLLPCGQRGEPSPTRAYSEVSAPLGPSVGLAPSWAPLSWRVNLIEPGGDLLPSRRATEQAAGFLLPRNELPRLCARVGRPAQAFLLCLAGPDSLRPQLPAWKPRAYPGARDALAGRRAEKPAFSRGSPSTRQGPRPSCLTGWLS